MTERQAMIPAAGTGLAAEAAIALVGLYRRTLSPALSAIYGPGCACRFEPTCSCYAAEALRVHGAVKGSWLAARRIVKCTPLHPGGNDPVPQL
ncbi:MAG TPA: membrane protein insertion efficiency factor YidD [Opitutaceae bacterium]|jgi:hypothetical protein